MRLVLVAVLSIAIVGCRTAAHRPAPPEPAPAPSTQQAVTSLDEAISIIDARDDWKTLPPMNVPRHPAEKFLKGLVIVIDPGHGGKDHAGHGVAGILEADMNWRVGVLLGRLLQDAGVNVTLTRHGDEFIELRDRAEIANNIVRPDGGIGADLFISVHHNSTSNRTTNWPSVWYHGTVDQAEVSIDAARFVALELGKATRTQVAVTSPLFSDELMYPGGFGVLRACRVPCFLCECSFYSVPEEEQRLADAAYNLREAYAIYAGLCEWAYGGRPTQSIPQVTLENGKLRITTTLDEGLPAWWGKERSRILASSIAVRYGTGPREMHRVPHEFDPKSRTLTVEIPVDAQQPDARLEIHFANMFSNHNWPQRYVLKPGSVDGKPALEAAVDHSTGPATSQATSRRSG